MIVAILAWRRGSDGEAAAGGAPATPAAPSTITEAIMVATRRGKAGARVMALLADGVPSPLRVRTEQRF